MKKTYKNPTLTVVKIQPAQLMIPASNPYDGGDVQGREASFSDWEDEQLIIE